MGVASRTDVTWLCFCPNAQGGPVVQRPAPVANAVRTGFPGFRFRLGHALLYVTLFLIFTMEAHASRCTLSLS